jgi:hypothetical protein
MIDDAEATQHLLLSDIERAIESELRVQRLDAAIVVCRNQTRSNRHLHSVFSRILCME